MRKPLFEILEHGLRALCYLFLCVAVFGVLGGSSCYVVSCYDDNYDDDFNDDDHHDCYDDDDDDDDDDDVSTPLSGSGPATVAAAGGGIAVEVLIEAGARVVLPAVRSRGRLVPRWAARASQPLLASFDPVPAEPGGPLVLSALRDLRGVGPFGPVALGPVGTELSESHLVRFAELFLALNAGALGLPSGLGPWEFVGVEQAGTETQVTFTAPTPAEGALFSTLVFDGFGVLDSVHHELAE